MALYTIYPVIHIDELEKAVNLQYDADINLRNALFSDGYFNDTCVYFYYDETSVDDSTEVALVKGYLEDILPDYSCVLLDLAY